MTSLFRRYLFQYFHDEDILFLLRNDFNFTRRFQTYWAELFSLAREKIPENFGERPNKAQFDSDTDIKIGTNANNLFHPSKLTRKGYDDRFLLIAHCTCVDWCFRGANEVN